MSDVHTRRLQQILKRRPVVLLGVGNPLRGDDGIGHLLADALAGLNGENFHSQPVGTAVENAMNWVRRAAGGVLIIADAVFDESRPPGSWAFYPAEELDSVCHTTHSIPLSLLISFWQKEIPGLEVRFLGISIRASFDLASLSPTLERTLATLRHAIESGLKNP